MGTRADFYVGVDKDAEWLGSVAYDGYPDGIDLSIIEATTEQEYRDAVSEFLADEDSYSTLPTQGWPWPWDTSLITDYAYAFDGVNVVGNCFGYGWFIVDPNADNYGEHVDSLDSLDYLDYPTDFPDMKAKQNVTLGSRSGMILIEKVN